MKLYHFGVSGGKDSTALLLWAVYESGIPLEQIRATFCNTGNEHNWTLDYISMLNLCVHPIEEIRGELLFYDLARKKGFFPQVKKRFCTQELKMKPTQAWVMARLSEGHEVILHSGVRAAESAERAKLPEEEWDPYFACVVRRPFLHKTLEDVWEMHDRYAVYRNPLYDKNAKRVGCWPCMMCRKGEIGMMARLWPERIDFLTAEETSFPDGRYHSFFQRDKVPLAMRTGTYVAKSGEVMKIATAKDVALWGLTVRGGRQFALGTIEEDAFEREEDKFISCPSALGQCE